MNRKQFFLTSVLAMVSAFLGGAVLTWFFQAGDVQAQSRQVLSAQEFRLVDSKGVLRGRLGTWPPNNENSAFFALNDSQGRRRLDIGVNKNGTPWAAFWNRSANAYGMNVNAPAISFHGPDGRIVGRVPGAQRRGLPKIGYAGSGGGGKADSARPEDIRSLQIQVDSLRGKVNEVTQRINLLSE